MSTPTRSILIADDEPALLRLMEFVLVKQGYVLRLVANGEDALQEVARERPDLVILDIMMPKLDGYAVAERLRAEESTQNLPIILLSAKAQSEDIERGETIGVNRYITKPFVLDEFVQTIRDVLSEAAAVITTDAPATAA